jgi:antitoxin FitA
MATLTIRGIDEDTKTRLRVRAARHGRSMEAEARAILAEALPARRAERGLGTRMRARLAAGGTAELELPSRRELPRAARLEK